MNEPEISITGPDQQGRYTLTASYRQIAAVCGGGVVPEHLRHRSMARWQERTGFGWVDVFDEGVGVCCGPDGLELGEITQWYVTGVSNAVNAFMGLLVTDKPVRRRLIKEFGPDRGMEYVYALHRATVHDGIEHLDPDKAVDLASELWLAEDDASHALETAIDDLTDLRYYVAEPDEHDYAPDSGSKAWQRPVSAAVMDDVVVTLQRLADARNRARPTR